MTKMPDALPAFCRSSRKHSREHRDVGVWGGVKVQGDVNALLLEAASSTCCHTHTHTHTRAEQFNMYMCVCVCLHGVMEENKDDCCSGILCLALTVPSHRENVGVDPHSQCVSQCVTQPACVTVCNPASVCPCAAPGGAVRGPAVVLD